MHLKKWCIFMFLFCFYGSKVVRELYLKKLVYFHVFILFFTDHGAGRGGGGGATPEKKVGVFSSFEESWTGNIALQET